MPKKIEDPENRILAQGRLWKKESLENYREYQKEFMKENYQSFVFRCNKETETDIIEKLKEVKNVAGYIKDLVKKDIAGIKPPVAHSAFIADELIKLASLREKEILTEEEFRIAKARLIDYKEGK